MFLQSCCFFVKNRGNLSKSLLESEENYVSLRTIYFFSHKTLFFSNSFKGFVILSKIKRKRTRHQNWVLIISRVCVLMIEARIVATSYRPYIVFLVYVHYAKILRSE